MKGFILQVDTGGKLFKHFFPTIPKRYRDRVYYVDKTRHTYTEDIKKGKLFKEKEGAMEERLMWEVVRRVGGE